MAFGVLGSFYCFCWELWRTREWKQTRRSCWSGFSSLGLGDTYWTWFQTSAGKHTAVTRVLLSSACGWCPAFLRVCNCCPVTGRAGQVSILGSFLTLHIPSWLHRFLCGNCSKIIAVPTGSVVPPGLQTQLSLCQIDQSAWMSYRHLTRSELSTLLPSNRLFFLDPLCLSKLPTIFQVLQASTSASKSAIAIITMYNKLPQKLSGSRFIHPFLWVWVWELSIIWFDCVSLAGQCCFPWRSRSLVQVNKMDPGLLHMCRLWGLGEKGKWLPWTLSWDTAFIELKETTNHARTF